MLPVSVSFGDEQPGALQENNLQKQAHLTKGEHYYIQGEEQERLHKEVCTDELKQEYLQRAIFCYIKAVKQGHEKSQQKLISFRDQGLYVRLNTQAIRAYEQAIKKAGRDSKKFIEEVNAAKDCMKLSDLVVMKLDSRRAPDKVIWGGSDRIEYQQAPSLFKSLFKFTNKFKYEDSVLAIDPAGEGKDETSYCVAKRCGDYYFITDLEGLEGAYNIKIEGEDKEAKEERNNQEMKEKLLQIVKQRQVRHILIEGNGGYGSRVIMLLRQGIKKINKERGKKNRIELSINCKYQKKGNQRKEKEVGKNKNTGKQERILATLQPLLKDHRLIIDQEVLVKDFSSTPQENMEYDPKKYINYQFFYQFLTIGLNGPYARGANLNKPTHDDRIDAVATAIAYLKERKEKSDRARQQQNDIVDLASYLPVSQEHLEVPKQLVDQETAVKLLKQLPDGGFILDQLLEENETLITLDELDDTYMELLAKYAILELFPKLRQIQVNKYQIGKNFTKALQGTSIREVDLSYSNIGNKGAAKLAKALQGTSIQVVELDNNGIGEEGAAKFARYLQGTSVQRVYLYSNRIKGKRAAKIAKAFRGTSVQVVDLSDNKIKDKGAIKFAKALKGTSIQEIDLGLNQIGNEGAIGFAKALQGASIQVVGLSENFIGDQGAEGFVKLLQGTRVHTVNLSSNQIEAQGAEAFARHLQATSVQVVDLSNNEIGAQGAEGFAKHLPGTRVHTVNLSGNQIEAQGAEAFARHLQATSVQVVDLSNNEIGAQGAEGFAKALQGTNVHTVNLRDNKIGAQGAIEFAKALQGTNVHTVYIEGNDIGDEGAIEFAKALQGTNVKKVDLGFGLYSIEPRTRKLLKKEYPNIEFLVHKDIHYPI